MVVVGISVFSKALVKCWLVCCFCRPAQVPHLPRQLCAGPLEGHAEQGVGGGEGSAVH